MNQYIDVAFEFYKELKSLGIEVEHKFKDHIKIIKKLKEKVPVKAGRRR